MVMRLDACIEQSIGGAKAKEKDEAWHEGLHVMLESLLQRSERP